MSSNTKHHSRLSHAGTHPDLRQDTPVNLRELRKTRKAFDQVRDPLIAAQLLDMNKTEAQRREESGRGSLMVKLQRPFPELRPKHDKTQLRARFNQDWLREQRAAVIAQYQEQRASNTHNEQPSIDGTPKPAREWTH